MTLSPLELSDVSSPKVSVQPKHVLFFGETGVGKSSVIRMLVGEDTDNPRVSSGPAIGCTSGSMPYLTAIDGHDFALWDTIGLNESERGSTHPSVATRELAGLAQGLEGSLHLLVYVIRGTRFREVIRLNYDMFYRVICGEQVPIVVVVTGLENEEPMEAWWDANKTDLERVGLVFQDHACITACRGPLKSGAYAYEEEYEESRQRLRKLVVQNCSLGPALAYHSQRLRKELEEIIGGSTNASGRSRRGNQPWQQLGDVSDHYDLEDTSLVLKFIYRLVECLAPLWGSIEALRHGSSSWREPTP